MKNCSFNLYGSTGRFTIYRSNFSSSTNRHESQMWEKEPNLFAALRHQICAFFLSVVTCFIWARTARKQPANRLSVEEHLEENVRRVELRSVFVLGFQITECGFNLVVCISKSTRPFWIFCDSVGAWSCIIILQTFHQSTSHWTSCITFQDFIPTLLTFCKASTSIFFNLCIYFNAQLAANFSSLSCI